MFTDKVFKARSFEVVLQSGAAGNVIAPDFSSTGTIADDACATATTPPLRSFLVLELRRFDDKRLFLGFRLMDDLKEPCLQREDKVKIHNQFKDEAKFRYDKKSQSFNLE